MVTVNLNNLHQYRWFSIMYGLDGVSHWNNSTTAQIITINNSVNNTTECHTTRVVSLCVCINTAAHTYAL